MDLISSPPCPPGVSVAPTQRIDSQGIGVPFKILRNFTAGATSVPVFTGNSPYKMRILRVEVHVTTRAAQTLTLNNGANAVTDAMSLNPAAANMTVVANTLNPTHAVVPDEGTLTGALSAAGAAGTLIIEAIKVP